MSTDGPVARLVLASASPARLETLRGAGISPEVIVSGVDEEGVRAASPAELAGVLAGLKARAVAARLQDGLVLGCDSVLELDGTPWGKPGSPDQATARWRQLRGRMGLLHTGHCLVDVGQGRTVEQVASTTVHFADLSDEEVAAYVATGEPLQVAGGFTVDGLGGAFVERIEGDHHNVVGLSLPLLRHLVHDLGRRWIDLWDRQARSKG